MCQRLHQLPLLLDTEDAGAEYLLAGDWMPSDEEVRDEFELEELVSICRCGGCGCFNCR